MESEIHLASGATVRRVSAVAEQLQMIAADAGRRGQAVPMPPAAVAEIATWMLTTARTPAAAADTSFAQAIAASLPELAPRE